MKSHDSHHNPSLGIPLTLIACIFNASMAMSAKLAVASTEVLVFVRLTISLILVVCTLPIAIRGTNFKKLFKIQKLDNHVVRWVSNILCLYAYFYSINTISVSLAVVLVMTSCLFIPLISYIWKKVPIAPVLWWALGTGFAGVVLIVGPTFHSNYLGLIAGLLSGIFAGISYVAARYQAKTDTHFTTNFYLYLVGAPIAFAIGGKDFIGSFSSYDAKTWALLGFVGLFGLLYQYFLLLALKAAQVRFVAAFLYSNIVFAFFLNWIFLKDVPSPLNYLGVLLVVLAGVLMSFLDPAKQKAHLKK